MARFYQSDYRQQGLTTDLPDEDALAGLMARGFQGTEKDFSRVIELLKKLDVQQGARVLDFGANWGYGVWQLRQAGYDAIGYEISAARAVYSEKLAVKVTSHWHEVQALGPYDVVFSSHVLEHTPDPGAAIAQKLSALKPGGAFIAFFPNGSERFQTVDFSAFHRLWGLVHPVMLNEHFVCRHLEGRDLVIGQYCEEDLNRLSQKGLGVQLGTLTGSEMMVVSH